MNYPLISEYIEAIKSAEDNFDELSYLRPVLGDDGLPIMTSGNFAVVFKMTDETTGKLYALKCFTKEQEGRAEAYKQIAEELKDVDSPYLVSILYLDNELFVDTGQTEEAEFPVLLMDWVEGKTLDKYLRENLDDKYALEMLAYRFSQLAQWLIPQPFAHGDLKPDNILVRGDGTLVLVDYDGMYVPAMKGQKARELGSPDFRHPLRTENDFDGHIDDFPLVSILLSLKVISLNPILRYNYGFSDRLLFSVNDYNNISDSIVVSEIQLFMETEDSRNLMSVFLLCLTSKIIPVSILNHLYMYFEGMNNEQYNLLPNELKETISEAVKGNMVEQEKLGSIFYNGDGLGKSITKAIYWYSASSTHGNPVALYNMGIFYHQGIGVRQNYAKALEWFYQAAERDYANAQYMVGLYFQDEKYGIDINLKESFKWLTKALLQGEERAQGAINDVYCMAGLNGFMYNVTVNIEYSEIYSFFKRLAEQGNQYGQYNLGLCYWDGIGIGIDRNEALKWYGLASNQGHIRAQEEVKKWKDSWFDEKLVIYSKDKKTIKGCLTDYLHEYSILEGTETIKDQSFSDLWSEIDYSYLEKVIIPSTVEFIGQCPFNKYLSEIICLSPYFEVENKTLYSKGKSRLIQCFANTELFRFPEEVNRVDDFAFRGCKSKRIVINHDLKSIGFNPFYDMDLSESKIHIESLSPKYKTIGSFVTEDSHKLIAYIGDDEVCRLPESIDEVLDFAFSSSKLQIIHLPDSIRKISDNAFSRCRSLKYVSAPIDIALKCSRIGAINSYLSMLEDDGGTSEIENEIIQAVFRQLPLDKVADSLGVDFYEIEIKLEELINCGWNLDIGYFLEDVMDNDNIKDIYNYITTHKHYSLWLLIKKYLCEKYSEDEIRLVWIKYLYDTRFQNEVKNE